MSFQPVVPLSGYSGWLFLQRTLESQQSAYSSSPAVQRNTDYFRENIGKIQTAEDLVADRRLLSVALGAFGLDEDINNRFFVQKVFEDGILENGALANRLSDKRYFAMSQAFGFGNGLIPRTGLSSFADEIIDRFETQQFAQAVGTQNENFRLALNVRESLEQIVADNTSQNAQWFAVMGNAPLRRVVETALGLPSSIAAVDIDQQLDAFKSRASSVFGTESVFDLLDQETEDDMIRLFLVRAEVGSGNSFSSGSIALSLLQ